MRPVKVGDKCTWGSSQSCNVEITRINAEGIFGVDLDGYTGWQEDPRTWEFPWRDLGTNTYHNLQHLDGEAIDVATTKASLNGDEYHDWHKYDTSLIGYQRRCKEWSEHNFPVRVTPEHQRIAQEFIARSHCNGSEELAYLLAARDHRSYQPLLGAVEELGELCHAHLKNEQGIRGTPEKWEEAKKDAIGDVLIYLLDYCNKEHISMQDCLDGAWAEIAGRDWIRFPLNGKTE